MKSIGIDIGSSQIKVVEASTNSKGVMLIEAIHCHALNPNPSFDADIQVIEYLRSMTASFDPASTRIVLGLRQNQVAVRHKYFPFADRLKIQRSLAFELEEELPFPAENAIFDAKLIATRGPTAEVLACATPKTKIEERMKKYGELGFEVSILSCEGVAFANCFEKWAEAPPSLPMAGSLDLEGEDSGPKRPLHLILNIGHTTTLVAAFHENRLVGVRSILWGGKNLADAIARRYELPYVEALKEMTSKAFILLNREGASYDQILFSDTIALQCRDLARDLKISILEFQSGLHGTVESVQITGGAGQVLNLQAYLTQALELPVNRVNVLDGFTSLPIERSPLIDSTIGVALGLAIEGLKKPRNPALQFLRDEFAKQNTSLKKFWDNWGATLQFAVAVYIAFFAYALLRENFSQNLADRSVDALKAQAQAVAKLGKKTANEAGVRKYIKDKKTHIKEMKTVAGLGHMNSAMDILKKVSDSLPPKSAVTLNVKKLDITDNVVTLEGTLASPAQISVVQKSLMGLASDGKVDPRSPSIGAPPGSVAFAASFKVDRGVR